MEEETLEKYQILCLAGKGGQAEVFLAKKDSTNYILKSYHSKPKAIEDYDNEI